MRPIHCPRLFTSFLCLLSGLIIQPYASAESTPALTSAKVTAVSLPQLRYVDASIEAVQQATISAQVSGRITEIAVDVDDYVVKGTIIVRLYDKEQQSALNASKARFDEADKEYQRSSDTFKKGLVAKAAVDTAEAKFKSARAVMEQSQEALENTRIRAPYSGIVTKRHVQVGEMARAGVPLISGLSLEKIRAVVELPQSLIYAVRQYKKAWLLVGKDQQTRIAAESLTFSSSADPDSHTFTLKLNLPAGDHGMYPGMSTKAAFMVGEVTRVVMPRQAVVRRSEVTGVYVQTEQGLLFRQIRLGQDVDSVLVEVLAGLAAGDNVVLDPQAAVAVVHATTPKKSQSKE